MNSIINKIKYEKTFFLLAPLLLLFLYISFIDVKYSVAADATGKWQQTRDVISKPLFDFSCSYQYNFDPMYKYIPGPSYFYFIDQGKCSHMYSYAFAYLLSPFLYFFSDYGIYFLNYLSWIIYIFSLANLAKLAILNNENAYLYGGLFAIFVSPAIIYSIGFTEVTISFALGAYSLYVVYASLKNDSEKWNYAKLFLSGLILGLIFSMRTESIIYTASLCFATFVYSISTNRGLPFLLKLFIPLTLGIIIGLGSVGVSHQILFGNVTGFRGVNAMKVMKEGFSIQNQLEIIRIQLFGGNRGLFTSIPLVLISFLYFRPSIRNKFKQDGLFFILIALMTTLLIVGTTPWGDFADWTPRYLALGFAPFFISVLQISLSDEASLLKKKIYKVIFVLLIIYSVLFNLTGVILTVKITNLVKTVNLAIEKFNADSIVVDTLIPYIYISQHNADKPIFSLNLSETDSVEKGKEKLQELVQLLSTNKQDRKILIIQIEGVSRFLFKGDEVENWNQKESFTLMKKIKFLLIEK